MAGSPNGAYEFQQGPQTIGGGHGGGKKRSKKMYRSYGMEDEGAVSANIMFIVALSEEIHMPLK